jgi:hypothetical protein
MMHRDGGKTAVCLRVSGEKIIALNGFNDLKKSGLIHSVKKRKKIVNTGILIRKFRLIIVSAVFQPTPKQLINQFKFMNRILRSQLSSNSRSFAMFETTTVSSSGRTHWSNSLTRGVAVVALLILSTLVGTAQTELISPTGAGGFELGSTLEANGWTVVNSSTDSWVVNNVPVPSAGSNCAYTSSTPANVAPTWTYSQLSVIQHMYIDVTIPVGQNAVALNFKWKAGGEGAAGSDWDNLKVFWGLSSSIGAPVANTAISSTFQVSGTGATNGMYKLNSSAWNTSTIGFQGIPGQTYRLVFSWKSDVSTIANPPAAVDEINLVSNAPITYSASANGGLWSSEASWVGGVVPLGGNSVSIPAGTTIIVDQVVNGLNDLNINGILAWNGTANAMTLGGNLTVNSGGSLLPYTTVGTTGVNLNIAGNLINDGYINMAAGSSTQGTINFNGSGSTISGTGTFQGDGTNGIIRILQFSNTGSNVINTSQNLVVYDLRLDGGSLNTNGKVIVDNTKMVYGLPFNTGIASISVTAMGAGYTASPMVGPTGATRWAAATALAANQVRMWNGNIYVVSVAGTSGASGPTHTSGTAVNGAATLLWVGTAGTLGAPFMSASAHVLGTFYFYANNLYICTTGGAGTAATPPTHTSGIASAGAAAFKYVGTVAKASAVWDATTSTLRAITITQTGSGYGTTAPGLVIVADQAVAPTTAAAATVVYFQSIIGPSANSVARRSPGTTISGGLTINNNSTASAVSGNNPQALSGVDVVYTTNGGNYNNTSTPNVGFTLPNNLNLVTSGGSGCTTPTIGTVTGATVSGTALATSAFSISFYNGSVVSVYCATPGTATYAVPPTVTVAGCAVAPTLVWPVNCLPTATANMNANGMIQSFTITNKGYGYNTAPTVGVSTPTPGPTAAPTTPVARLGLYNYTIAVNAPTTTASAAVTEDAFVPANRIINVLSLGANAAGFNVTGGNLTLIGSSPLSLTASTNVNVLDLGGSSLIYPWNQYGGTSGTYNVGGTKAYVRNGSLIMNGRGSNNTWSFPFAGSGTTSVQVFTGAANATNIVSAKISDLGAPTNTTLGGTAFGIGTRSFKINTTTLGGGVGTAGPTATIRLPYNDIDALTTTQDLTFISEAPSTSGPWNLRSAAVGASGALAAAGSLTTPIVAPGPVTLADGNVYAFSSLVPAVTSIDVTTLCANSGTFTITGTNLTGVTSITIGGVSVGSFTVVNGTTITGFAGAAASGVVTVTNSVGASASGSQTVSVNASPNAPTVSAASQTLELGNAANVTATGNGGTLLWYTQAFGGVSVLTGATLNLVPCASTTYYVAETDGTCEGARTAVAITVTFTTPSITPSVATFCGAGGTVTLTANNLMAGAIASWTSLTAGVTLTSATGTTTEATLTQTSEFRLSTTVNGCATPDALVSVGVYPLPSATVTTSASGVCPGTSATINSGLSAGNFAVVCITPRTVLSTPPANASVLCNGGTASTTLSGGSLDDGYWNSRPIGFDFNYFGVNQTQVMIGTNGTIIIGGGTSTQYNFTGGFPSTANPANCIAAVARDLQLNSTGGSFGFGGGAVRHWTEGVAPNRRFVVQYANCATWYSTNANDGRSSVEVVLYETLGTVEIYVIEASNPTATTGSFINDTRNKYIGLQNGTRTIGATAPNCSSPFQANYWNGISNQILSPLAWRFNPPADYLTIWSATDVNGTTGLTTNVDGSTINTINGFSATVAPLLTTQYSISYANATTGCSNLLSPAQVTMEVLGTTAPQGVIASSTGTTVCPGTSITLSTNYTGSLDGLTLQWETSTDGGTSWTDMPSANAITLTTTFNANASYRLKFVSCGGTPSYSSPVVVSVPSYTCPTCTTFASNAADEEIYSFTLNTATTPSAYAGANGCSTVAPGAGSILNRYSNFTSLGSFTNLISGVTNTITVLQDECDGPTYFSNGFAAFIDYNHDGDFTDAGEKVYSDGAATLQGPRTINGTFVVPNDAIPGLAVMRIMVVENVTGNAITPCLTYTYGETEDYLVTINPPCNPTLFSPPLVIADDPDATVCGNQTSQLTAFDFNGSANPIYMWYNAPTGGTLLQASTSNFFTPPAISATTSWYVATNTGTCVTQRFPVTLNWISAPTISVTNSNPASCGTTFVPTNIAATSSNSGYSYSWTASPSVGSGIVSGTAGATLSGVTPTLNGVYNFTATAVDAVSGCAAAASTSVAFYAPLTGSATVTQPLVCGGNGSVNFGVNGSGTVFVSDFTSAALNPAQAELCNNATITGGKLQLTAPANNQKGGILITNTTGLASNDFQIDFDMITTAGTTPPADGFSYSYGPDVVCMPTPIGTGDNVLVAAGAANPENGSGSGIRLSFDAYTNGVNVNGIYLMYNCLRKNPSSTLTPAEGLYYFDANTSWIGGANTHVTIKINALGQMSMWLAGTQVLNNAQLPADYLTADKSTWKHAFAARTGGLNQGHLIDNLDIHYNNFYEYSVDNGATWTATSPVSVPSPSTVHSLARYVTQPACSVDYGTSSVLFPVPAPTAVTGGSACLNASTLNVTAFGPPLGGTQTATTTLGSSLALTANGTLSLTGAVNVPAGATITGAVLSVAGISTAGGTWASDITVSMTGVSSLAAQDLSTDLTVTNVSYTYVGTIPTGNGNVTVNFANTWSGTATINSVSLIVSYSLPSSPSWFSSSTPSAGNLLGTGSPFNVVGTTSLPSTATTSTGTIYAATMVVNGASTCYSTSVPAAINVGVPLTASVVASTSYTSTTTLSTGAFTVPFGSSNTVSGNVVLPAGAVVTGTQLLINGVTSTNFTYATYIQVAASGAVTLANQSVAPNFIVLNTPTNYTLNPSVIANTGGTVFVTVTNTGTSGVATISSVQLVVTYTGPVLTSICPGAAVAMSVSTTGGGGAQSYQWNLNGTPIDGATANGFNAIPSAGDSYTCTVLDACNPSGVTSAAYAASFFSVTAGSISGPSAINVNDFTSTPPGGGTFVLAGQTAGSTIQWVSSNNGSAPWTNIGGATSGSQSLYAAGAAGTLTLSAFVTSPDGCIAQAGTFAVAMGNAIDTPCTARPVTLGNQDGLVFSTAAATVSGGETGAPALGCNVQNGWCNSTLNGTIWFSLVAPASGRVSIAAPGWDNQLAIYSATNCADFGTFTLINANDDGAGLTAFLTNVKCLTPGATYYIQLDGYGAVGASTIVITDLGNTAPVITNVPANIALNNNLGICGATATWTAPTVTDDQGCVTTTSNFNSGASFPVGVTTVTYTSTDAQGLVTTASFTVTVTDNELPTVTAPSNVTVNANSSCDATSVDLGTPTTADNCTVSSVTNNALITYPLGVTTVTWTVTDGAGNIQTATQTVTVVDATNPTIAAPANVTVDANSSCNATGVVLGTPVTADNCSVASVTSNAPSTFPLGTTTVTWTVTDGSGNNSTATQTVTVVDVTNPTITAPANVAVDANSSCNATGVVLGTPVTADNCSVASVTNNAPSTFPLGTTTVTWTVTDGAGLSVTAVQTVTVVDATVPTITAPAPVTVTAALNACTATATLGSVNATDNCGILTSTNNAPATFPIGNTTVTYTVTDVNGNVATATQVVTVEVNPANIWYVDADGDNYGVAGATVTACSQPTGYAANTTDCNDANVNINPGEIEICGNTIDDNCNGTSEEGCLNPGENPSNAISMSTSIWPNCNAVNGTLVNASASGSAQTICLTGEDKWHQFVATSEGVSIVVNSTSADILIELQTAAGVLVAQENAVSGLGGEILNHYGLTAGQVYKIGVRNYNSAIGTGTYSICAKMLKRGGCDYGPGPYTLCQYFKATWAGATGTSYTFTFTGVSGPASGNVYTRTQNSDICVLSSVLPTLPYGSTYNVLISNTYTLNNGAGVAEIITVPGLAPCSMSTATQPATALRVSNQCAAGPRFRGAIVASLPWVCGSTNWRWEFTELDTQGQPVGLPITVNRGAASNYINLGTVLQLQYGKTYSVRTAPILPYTGTDYQWGAPVCMSIVGSAGMIADGSQVANQAVRVETANEVNMSLYPNPTHGTDVNINLSGVESDNVQIRVVDAMGRQVWSNRYSVNGVLNTNITFERPLANGLYFVEAIFNGEVQTQRMMVQK